MKSINEILSFDSSFKVIKTSYIILLVTIFLFFTSYTAFAQSEAIDDGVDWLYDNQNVSGSWGDPDKSEFRDTTIVLNALKKVGETGSDYDSAVSFINWANANNNDYLARKAKVLARDGEDVSTLIDDLITTQNEKEINNTYHNYPEGGWGIDGGYSTNCLDTSLALDALNAAGLSGGLAVSDEAIEPGETDEFQFVLPEGAISLSIVITELIGAIEFRIKKGSPPTLADPYYPITAAPVNLSGLPVEPGTNYIRIDTSASSTYSFEVSYVADGFDTKSLLTPINYLMASQNVDGGWGISKSADSNIYITAKVLITLEHYSTYFDLATNISNGISWLISQQNPDNGFGAEGSSIYETALAYLAIIQHNPSSPEAAQAKTFIETNQLGNGSWDDNAYTTAMALRVLSGPELDRDKDGIPDHMDNCPDDYNPDQANNDGDAEGDICDPDDDNDGVADEGGGGEPSSDYYFVTDVTDATGTIDIQPPDSSIYIRTYSAVPLGWYDLTDQTFDDGEVSLTPSPIAIYIDYNSCGCITIEEGDTLTLETDAGQITIYLPAINPGWQNFLFVSDDGSTYYDPDLTEIAQSAVVSSGDNCPFVSNPDQWDDDEDDVGDVCDNCPTYANADQSDYDIDEVGNVCDNCWYVDNTDQIDSNGNCTFFTLPYSWDPGCGDACEISTDDIDADGIPDFEDNCLSTPNGPFAGTCTAGTIGTLCTSDEECGVVIEGVCDGTTCTSGSIGASCNNDDECDVLGECSMDQEDNYPPGGNGIGDACDCECDFNCDGNVDAPDVTNFLADFGRSVFFNPCSNADPCNGDSNCDKNVDAPDVEKFLEDFGRFQFNNPCPACEVGDWCVYE